MSTIKHLDPTAKAAPGRDSWLELGRIVAMFLIVACHVVEQTWNLAANHATTAADFDQGWANSLLQTVIDAGQYGVILFFLVSGWFARPGQAFLTKFTTTWLHTILYTVPIMAASLALPSLRQSADKPLTLTILQGLTPFLFGNYWFVTAYLTLMLAAPLLLRMLTTLDDHQLGGLLGFLLALSLWRLYGTYGLAAIPAGQPSFAGAGYWNLFLYALTCFIGGILLRRQEGWIRQRVSPRLALLGLFGSLALTVLLYHFLGGSSLLRLYLPAQSLPQFLGGSSLFLLFVSLSSRQSGSGPGFSSRPVNRLAAVTFSVYLIHSNGFLLRRLAHYLPALQLAEPPASTAGSSPFAADLGRLIALALLLFALSSLIALVYDWLVVRPLTRRLGHWVSARQQPGGRQ